MTSFDAMFSSAPAPVINRALKGFGHDSHQMLSVEWYTPAWIFEMLGLQFDLDVASPKSGIPWIPAKRWFSEDDDGLAQPWEGLVWCNPPYGNFTKAWLKKMSEHRNGVALVFARTDCLWFHDYVTSADAICFIKGRVKFVDAFGVSGESGAGAGSMLIAWGDAAVQGITRIATNHKGHLMAAPKQDMF